MLFEYNLLIVKLFTRLYIYVNVTLILLEQKILVNYKSKHEAY